MLHVAMCYVFYLVCTVASCNYLKKKKKKKKQSKGATRHGDGSVCPTSE